MSLYIRKQARAKVRRRIRKKISGTAERPRLAIHFSNQNTTARSRRLPTPPARPASIS